MHIADILLLPQLTRCLQVATCLKDNGGTADPYLNNARLSYFGRLNYDYEGKYLAEFVFREDGSYVFPPGSSIWLLPRHFFRLENI